MKKQTDKKETEADRRETQIIVYLQTDDKETEEYRTHT
jgi:hypothetical protein